MFTASDKEKLNYIQNTIDPTPQLFQYWKDTSPVRKHDFHEGNMEIRELFEKYRCLKLQFGAELVCIFYIKIVFLNNLIFVIFY